MFLVAVSVSANSHDAVFEILEKGNTQSVLKALDSLSRVQSAPGWVRAKSLRVLGDHQFTRGDYRKAADFYQQASKLDNLSMYRYLYALSIAMSGQTDAAREMWRVIAGDEADPVSAEALAMLRQTGGVDKPQIVVVDKKDDPVTQQAISADKQQPAPVDKKDEPVSQQTVSADKQQSAPVDKKDEPGKQQAVSVDKQQSVPVDKPVIPVNTAVYTIQVGAFGSKDNADNLVKRLTGKYSDITVSPTAGGSQTLYRVRVGSFKSREDAAAFANKFKTDNAELTAMVIEK